MSSTTILGGFPRIQFGNAYEVAAYVRNNVALPELKGSVDTILHDYYGVCWDEVDAVRGLLIKPERLETFNDRVVKAIKTGKAPPAR